jgi:hypothetical protein
MDEAQLRVIFDRGGVHIGSRQMFPSRRPGPALH